MRSWLCGASRPALKDGRIMEVEVEMDGQRYVGEVHESDGVVTVMTDGGYMEMTSIGGSGIESIARTLLLRMVRAGRARPKAA